jgi:hypothetical protein
MPCCDHGMSCMRADCNLGVLGTQIALLLIGGAVHGHQHAAKSAAGLTGAFLLSTLASTSLKVSAAALSQAVLTPDRRTRSARGSSCSRCTRASRGVSCCSIRMFVVYESVVARVAELLGKGRASC